MCQTSKVIQQYRKAGTGEENERFQGEELKSKVKSSVESYYGEMT